MAHQRFRNNRWVMTGHFLETASGSGKPHMYCTVARLHTLCPSFCLAFLHLGFLCFPAISLLLRSSARLKWRPSGNLRVRLLQSFPPSIPTVSCPSQVTICLLSPNPTFFISFPSGFFLRRSSAHGGFSWGHCSDRRHPRIRHLCSFSYPRTCSAHFSFLPRSP
jgi:hypothetical protein